MHLITGHTGEEHVTSADAGSMHAGFYGNGNYVLPLAEKLAYTRISNTVIRIGSGDVLMNGRHARIDVGSYVDVTLESGRPSTYRTDLIICRYSVNTATRVEKAEIIVLKGTESSTTPAPTPAYKNKDILSGSTTADFPLYKIEYYGAESQKITRLFNVSGSVTEHGNHISTSVSEPKKYLKSTNISGVTKWGDIEEVAIEPSPSTKSYLLSVGTAADKSVQEIKSEPNVKIEHSNGTTAVNGLTKLILGNNLGTGTSGNSSGEIDVFAKSGKYVKLSPSDDLSSSKDVKLPSKSGTLALISDVPITYTYHNGAYAKESKLVTIKMPVTVTSNSQVYPQCLVELIETAPNMTSSGEYLSKNVLLSSRNDGSGTLVLDRSGFALDTTGVSCNVVNDVATISFRLSVYGYGSLVLRASKSDVEFSVA